MLPAQDVVAHPRSPGTPSAAPPARPPLFLHHRSAPWFIISVACFGIFTHLFFYGMLVPVAPTALVTRAGVPQDELQKWNSVLQAIYGGAALVASPAAGWFTDRMGSRRLPFLLCLACLAAATALLAIGTHIGLWVAGRILQGVSASMLWVVCLALLSDTVGKAGIGHAVGIIGIPMSVGPIVGPLLGGVLYAYGGHYAVFGLMFALLVIDGVLRLAMIEKKVARRWLDDEREDKRSAGPDKPPSKPSIPEPPRGGDAVAQQGHESSGGPRGEAHGAALAPIPMLRLLQSSRVCVGLTGGLLQSSLNVAFDSTLPLVVNSLFGWQQTGQGLIFITILIPSLLQPVFGATTDRYQQGRRLFAACGCLLATPAYVLLGLVTHDNLDQKVLLCALLVVIGLAMAMAMPAIIAEIGAAVDDERAPSPGVAETDVVATGWSLVNAAYAAGCLLGPLFAGLIRSASSWQTTAWCLGVLSGTTGVFLLLLLGGWIGNLELTALLARVAR